jgi:DNA-directed RNA polymerase
MAEFRHGGHGGGFKSRGGDRGGFRGARNGGFHGGDRGPVIMTKTICDQCHKPCEVPFRPTAGKPVYCNACFGGKKEVGFNKNGPARNGDYKTPPRTDFGADINKVSGIEIKKQIENLNIKIDRLTKLIEDFKSVKIVAPEVKVEKVNPPTLKSSGEAKKKVAKITKAKKLKS